MIAEFSDAEYHNLLVALGRAGKGGRLSKSDRALAVRVSKELQADFGAVERLNALARVLPVAVVVASPRTRWWLRPWVWVLMFVCLDYLLYALLSV